MKRKGIVLFSLTFIFFVLALAPFSIISVKAASWTTQDTWGGSLFTGAESTNLNVTHNSGGWVSGGYDFDNSAYANVSGWAPFNNRASFSVIIWFMPDSIAAVTDYLISEYEDTNDRVSINRQTDDMYVRLGDGATVITGIINNEIDVGSVYCVMMAWNKSENSGKLSMYLFNNNTGDFFKYDSPSGITSNTSANADMFLGGNDPFAEYFDGKIYHVALYKEKITEAVFNITTRLGKILNYGEPWHYYTLNEGSDDLFNDHGTTWFYEDYFEADLVGGPAAPPIQWYYQETFEGDIAHTTIITPFDVPSYALAVAALLGLIIMPTSTLLIAAGIKSKTITRDSFFWLLFLFFIGLAFVVGAGM